ncbi:hypothetical protein [Methanosalsum natronophilum]|uniref:hypothetical protein n=1 Tax=Methanosalsum natronophilum TaxID=768733 RepID=UPI002167686A|nr:hypothetical protein [Methanosalsum natronophilum]MCS3923964.1 hypothetical protein [Methanosalsum natronophilum]
MRISLEPIGTIKKTGNYSEILIYSDFEQIIKNLISQIGKNSNNFDILVIHTSQHINDGHQVKVTKTKFINRIGNILKVKKIEANEDSVIDVRINI